MAESHAVTVVAGTNLVRDPAIANFTFVLKEAAPLRYWIDGKTPRWPMPAADAPPNTFRWGVPVAPEQFFQAYGRSGGFKLPAQGLIMKANIVPAALRSAVNYWGPVPIAAARLIPQADQQLGARMAGWVADRETLLWDTEGGTATVKALIKPLLGQAQIYPSPFWLTEALRALVAGEAHVLSRNASAIQEALDAVNTWLGEARWFGSTPTAAARTTASTLVTKLQAKLNQGQAMTAQQGAGVDAAGLAALQAAGAQGTYIPPPKDPRPLWQTALMVGAGGLVLFQGWKWYQTRSSDRLALHGAIKPKKKPRIAYRRQGMIERPVGHGRYRWYEAYSEVGRDLFPRLTRREAQADARGRGAVAVFER